MNDENRQDMHDSLHCNRESLPCKSTSQYEFNYKLLTVVVPRLASLLSKNVKKKKKSTRLLGVYYNRDRSITLETKDSDLFIFLRATRMDTGGNCAF